MPTGANNPKADSAPSITEPGILGTWAESRSILDAIKEGVSIHSASGGILWANRKLCEVYRKPLAELMNLTCIEAFHGDGPACPHEEVLSSGSAMRLSADVSPYGGRFSVTIEPLFDESDNTNGFVRVIRDVSTERNIWERLREAEQMASLGQLLSGLSHDVGTPLNVISGYAEYMLMRTDSAGQGHKELTAILAQTRRIAAVFRQALDLARPPQGRTGAIEINPLLTDSLDLVGHHFRKAGVKATLTCRIVPPLIYGEAPQLRQAFFNLLLNAGQRIGAGGSLQVVVEEAVDMPGFLRLAFLGTGPDQTGHDFSRSFAGFFSGQSESDLYGIGLYLTRKILDEAGARIVAEPCEHGIGITIYLPLNAGGRA